VAEVTIICGIIVAISGHPNIYSAPEYGFNGDGANWGHAAAHLFIGTAALTVFPWVLGSLVLFVTRLASPQPKTRSVT
jgi:hypothetical protein